MSISNIRAPRAARWLAALITAVLAACGGGGDSPATGTLHVSLTDAPACGYDAVHVTVDRVRVHQSDTAADADGGWQELVLAQPRRVDLLSLTNGVLEDLGSTTLPAGTYTQLRLVLAENSAADPMANSVTPTGAAEVALDTPSAQQSGLKIKTSFTVAPTQVADLVLDFDACKSVVKRGNSGRYNLKPVLTAIPVFAAAGNAVQGYVAPALANGSTAVSVQQAGVVVKATAPDATTGKFVLSPVPVGTYDLVLAADGRVTSVITGVPVIDTARTTIGSETARPKLGDHHRVGVADAVPDARLFEGGRDGPDLALGSGDFGGDLGQNLQPRRVDAVVVGDQDAHGLGGSFRLAPD